MCCLPPGSRTTSNSLRRELAADALEPGGAAHGLDSDGPRRAGDQPARGGILRLRLRHAAARDAGQRCARLPLRWAARPTTCASKATPTTFPFTPRTSIPTGSSLRRAPPASPGSFSTCKPSRPIGSRPPAMPSFIPSPATPRPKGAPTIAASIWSCCRAPRSTSPFPDAAHRRRMAKDHRRDERIGEVRRYSQRARRYSANSANSAHSTPSTFTITRLRRCPSNSA